MNATPRIAREQKLLADHAVLLLTVKRKGSGLSMPEFSYIEEVHHRAETVTPLLKELLAFRPSPHWDVK